MNWPPWWPRSGPTVPVGWARRCRCVLERWFTVASRSWAPTTIRQTRSVLDRYLHPHIGSIPVGSLTAARIDELYAELGRSGGAKGQPLSAGTVARVHVVLRSALAQAVRWEWIWDNPALVVEDLAHHRLRDLVTEVDELAVYAPVSPRRVLSCEPHDEVSQLDSGRWSALTATGLGPESGDSLPVPTHRVSGASGRDGVLGWAERRGTR